MESLHLIPSGTRGALTHWSSVEITAVERNKIQIVPPQELHQELTAVGIEVRDLCSCSGPLVTLFSVLCSPVTSPSLSKHQGRTSTSRCSLWTMSTASGSGGSTPWTSWWSTIRRRPSSPVSMGRSSTSSEHCSDHHTLLDKGQHMLESASAASPVGWLVFYWLTCNLAWLLYFPLAFPSPS